MLVDDPLRTDIFRQTLVNWQRTAKFTMPHLLRRRLCPQILHGPGCPRPGSREGLIPGDSAQPRLLRPLVAAQPRLMLAVVEFSNRPFTRALAYSNRLITIGGSPYERRIQTATNRLADICWSLLIG
jgi:hypothetical protein